MMTIRPAFAAEAIGTAMRTNSLRANGRSVWGLSASYPNRLIGQFNQERIMALSKNEIRRTTKAEFVKRLEAARAHLARRDKELKAAQNQLDDERLAAVQTKTEIDNLKQSVQPLQELLEDAKKEAERKQAEVDEKQDALATCWREIDGKNEAIAELKHQRNWCAAVGAIFAALGFAALVQLQ